MSGRIRYTEEFKLGAVAQVTDRGHSVTSVAGRLGVSTKSLYDWVKRYGDAPSKAGEPSGQIEIKRLKAELRRVTEERDILKWPRRTDRQVIAKQIPRGSSQKTTGEVRLYQRTSGRVFGARHVPRIEGSCEWVLCVAEEWAIYAF